MKFQPVIKLLSDGGKCNRSLLDIDIRHYEPNGTHDTCKDKQRPSRKSSKCTKCFSYIKSILDAILSYQLWCFLCFGNILSNILQNEERLFCRNAAKLTAVSPINLQSQTISDSVTICKRYIILNAFHNIEKNVTFHEIQVNQHPLSCIAIKL